MACPLTVELSRKKYNSDNTDQVVQFTQLPNSSPGMEAAEDVQKAKARDFFLKHLFCVLQSHFGNTGHA